MKIMIVGGAGAMARVTAMDLVECPEVKEIVIADYREEKAKSLSDSFHASRVKGCFIDATQVNEMVDLMKGCDAVINSAQLDVNLNVMEACLKAHCHYNDLGGLFHISLKQLELFDEFKKAGLTAVLGIGSAPGTTNVMGRYGYDQLDEVEIVRFFSAGISETDQKAQNVFYPPYSIRTIMDEYGEESVQFIDGEYKTVPPLAGEMEVVFPEPIGKMTVMHTLHSEPATVPESFKDKGIKEATWRLGLPVQFEEKAIFLASIGLASRDPIDVQGQKVNPIEFLAALIEKHIQEEEKLRGEKIKSNRVSCNRAYVSGKKDNKPVEITVDCMNTTHSRWGVLCGTSVPPSVVAQMQAKGIIHTPGVWGPEQIIDPELYFKELAKRELNVRVTIQKDVI